MDKNLPFASRILFEWRIEELRKQTAVYVDKIQTMYDACDSAFVDEKGMYSCGDCETCALPPDYQRHMQVEGLALTCKSLMYQEILNARNKLEQAKRWIFWKLHKLSIIKDMIQANSFHTSCAATFSSFANSRTPIVFFSRPDTSDICEFTAEMEKTLSYYGMKMGKKNVS